MNWTIIIGKRVSRQMAKLPSRVQNAVALLIEDIKENGPIRGDWPNYGKLAGAKLHHCHLRRGRPTYVAVWEEIEKAVKLIEVKYVGTHENAPY
jgi:mRNA-degrading endonuclease RelE of RelBE toxin-antitoxin system